jgi:hypothetical protein
MKYIIENKNLFKVIYNEIDSYLNENGKMIISPGHDYILGGETEDLIWFYRIGEEDYEFEYTKPEWYTRKLDNGYREGKQTAKFWLPRTPFVSFTSDSSFGNRMDNMFGPLWRPVFEKWFEDNFPDLPVNKFFYNEGYNQG